VGGVAGIEVANFVVAYDGKHVKICVFDMIYYNLEMMNIIKSARFSLKFFRIVDGNIIEKARKTVKYCPQYHYHLSLQQKAMKINL
jgi:hypothetical protein